MINPTHFVDLLLEHGVNFFTGVPDSLLKDFCSSLPDDQHVIAANEGGSVALATGSYLVTGNIPLVYMQNSGLGNAVNPLMSLADPSVYAIPMIVMVGWRGEPSTHDEPQHVKQGAITESLLASMQIPYVILDNTVCDVEEFIQAVIEKAKSNTPVVILVKRKTFESIERDQPITERLTQLQAVDTVVKNINSDSIVVSTTGYTSRLLNEIRPDHPTDFLTVGSMGHASQIALGISYQLRDKLVVCLDGDGSTLMHMGSLATVGQNANRYLHVLLNNSCHASVGGQSTTNPSTDFCSVAKACGYKSVHTAHDQEFVKAFLKENNSYPAFLEIKISNQTPTSLSRPDNNFQLKKSTFMRSI